MRAIDERHTGSPCITAADPWLIAAPSPRNAVVADMRRRWRCSIEASDGPSRVRATADSLELPRPNQVAYLGMFEPACAELTEQDDLVHVHIRSALARV